MFRSFGSVVLACSTAIALATCTSSSTEVTAPTAAKCAPSMAVAGAANFPATGGTGSVSIVTTSDCAWALSADAPWISLSARNGQGSASVSFSVAINPDAARRTSSIAIGTTAETIAQDAAPCRFSLSQTSSRVGAGGGTVSVGLAANGCQWTATSNAGWIAVTGGSSGNASATITLAVSPNSGAARVGQVNVGDQAYTVSQDGDTSPPAASPPSPPPPPATGHPPPPPPGGGDHHDDGGKAGDGRGGRGDKGGHH
jgi:hypothetical protein